MLKQCIENLGLKYIKVPIALEQSLFELFENSTTFEPQHPMAYFYFGVYHEFKMGNMTMAKYWYQYAIEQGESNSILNLANIYERREEQFRTSRALVSESG